jgi:protein TonB
MSFINPSKRNKNSLVVISLALLAHILIIWFLISGLAQKAKAFLIEPMNATLIEEVKHIPKPEIPKPKVVPKVYVAKAEVPPPPVSNANIQATVTPPPVSAPPAPSAPVAPVVQAAKMDMSVGCQKPQYPETSRLANEQGAVTVGYLIGADGSIKDSKIMSSSGFKRLDTAARDALSLCKFQPGTENGQFVDSWARIRYVWRLN